MLGVDMSSGDGIIGQRNHGSQMGGCVSRGVPLYGTAILFIHLYLHRYIMYTNAKKH